MKVSASPRWTGCKLTNGSFSSLLLFLSRLKFSLVGAAFGGYSYLWRWFEGITRSGTTVALARTIKRPEFLSRNLMRGSYRWMSSMLASLMSLSATAAISFFSAAESFPFLRFSHAWMRCVAGRRTAWDPFQDGFAYDELRHGAA